MKLYSIAQSKRYRYQYRQFLRANANSPLVHVHCPKAGGTSLSSALCQVGPGHFPLKEVVRCRQVPIETIVTTVRSPADRMISTFKYAHSTHLASLHAPTWIVTRYVGVSELICAPEFEALVQHHYFFTPHSTLLDGIDDIAANHVYLRFTHLEADAEKVLGLRLPRQNIGSDSGRSPQSLTLTDKAVDKLHNLYARDYELLDTVTSLYQG